MKIELFIAFLNLHISTNIFSFSCLLIPTLLHLHLCNPKIGSSPDSISADLNLYLESSQKVSEKKSATAEDIFGSFFRGSYFFLCSSSSQLLQPFLSVLCFVELASIMAAEFSPQLWVLSQNSVCWLMYDLDLCADEVSGNVKIVSHCCT
jgi:hypothetical protein